MDLDQIRGGYQAIRALMNATGIDGRPFINRYNIAALGVMEEFGAMPTLRVVTTETTNSRKEDFPEIYKAGYFKWNGRQYLLVMYDWRISSRAMVEVVAPILADLFDGLDGDFLTSALAELVDAQERLTFIQTAMQWFQRALMKGGASVPLTKGQTSLQVALLTLGQRTTGTKWGNHRVVTDFIDDFHVAPTGDVAVMSAGRVFQINPRVLLKAVHGDGTKPRGEGGQDPDFIFAREHAVEVGPNASLSRYSASRFGFTLPVYDQGALTVYDPGNLQPLYTHPSECFVMSAADGSNGLFALKKTLLGRRRVARERVDHDPQKLALTQY